MKHPIALFILLTIIVITAGCNKTTKKSHFPIYRKAVYYIPKTLDLTKTISTSEHALTTMLYDGLFRIDRNLNVVPDLVEKWKITDEGKQYHFKIKSGVTFSDNTPLTTKHVAASIERLRDKSPAGHDLFKIISKIAIKDKLHITIHLTNSYPPFTSMLASPIAKIIKEPTNTNQYPFGSGAFVVSNLSIINKIKVLTLKSRTSILHALPFIRKMELWEISEEQALKLAKTGIIHDTSIYSSPPDQNSNNDKLSMMKYLSSVTWLLALNNSSGPLQNNNLRSCLATRFYNSDFVQKFIPSHRKAYGFVPPTLPGYIDLKKQISSEGKTRCNLKQKIILDYPNALNNGDKMCAYMTSHIFKGLNIECAGRKFNHLINRIKDGSFHISFLSMTLDLPDMGYFLGTFESKSDFNLGNLKDNQIDQWLSKAMRSSDRRERASLYRSINQRLFDIHATINISYPYHISYKHSCIEGLQIGLAGDQYTDYSTIWMASNCQYKDDFSETAQKGTK